MICPNKSHPVWKEIAAKHGENSAMLAYMRNGLEIPATLEDAEKLVAGKDNFVKDIKAMKDELNQTLTIQKAIYQKRPGGQKYVDDINDILKAFDNNEDLLGIVELVNIANKYTSEALVRMKVLQEKMAYIDKMSNGERQELVDTLLEVKQFMSAYTILEEAQSFFNEDTVALKELQSALKKRMEVVRLFKNVHEEVLSTWLSAEAERVNKGLEKQGVDKSMMFTKQKIKNLLHTATSDISVWEAWLGAQANSSDPITGLVAATIKSMAYDAHLEDYHIQNELVELYNQSTRDKSTVGGFNSPYLRKALVYESALVVDDKGQPILNDKGEKQYKYQYVERRAYHTEYLEDQFAKAKRDYYEDLKKKGVPIETWSKEIARWYYENTILRNIDEVTEFHKKNMSATEFKIWQDSNLHRKAIEVYPDGSSNLDFIPAERIAKRTADHIWLYSGDYLQPIEKYKNPQYEKLKSDPYYMKLLDTYNKANLKYHPSKRLEFGIIPQVKKESVKDYLHEDSLNAEALKNVGKQSVNITAYDANNGIQRPDGSIYREVPSIFTTMVNDSELSVDLLRSTLMYSQAANRYNAMSQVQPYVELLTDMVEGNPDFNVSARQVVDTNAAGVGKLNPITKKYRAKRGDHVNRALMEFLDKVVYNEQEIQQIIGNNISVNKVVGVVTGYTALTNLAINISTGINNETFGQFQVAVEAAFGDNYNKSDWAWAQAEYMRNVPELIGDFTAGYPKSKLGRLAFIYDAMQGEHKDEYGKEITKGGFSKVFSRSSLFFLQKSGEHHIQVATMMMMMKNTKVQDKSGKTYSLWDAYDKNGELLPGIQWTKDDQFALMQRLHRLNKSLHGIYNKFDSPTLQRKWYGKLILLFRKYVYTGFERRYAKKYIDIEAGQLYEGYMRTFFGKVYEELRELKFKALFGQNLTKEERTAMYRSYTDVLTGISLYILFGALRAAAGDDDEENSWLMNQTMLQSRRLAGDIMFYSNPIELMKLTRTPSAAYGTIDNAINFIGQLANPFEQYERKSGAYDKGDYKINRAFSKIVPVFSGLNKSLNPGNQLTFYNNIW